MNAIGPELVDGPGGLPPQATSLLRALEAHLAAQEDAFEPEVRHMVAHCLEGGGKRLRPLLVFASGWSAGGPSPAVGDALVRAAGVLELVHLATLVHDDIMDRADRRRSRPTAARRFGPGAAVLLGDAIFAHAVSLAAGFPTPFVCREVAGAARRVCSGEILQSLGSPPAGGADPLARYWRVIELKTAELFRTACRLGSSLAGHPEPFVEAAGRFGTRLGVAFQVHDDLLDVAGAEEKAGKTLGTDLLTGKVTLPLHLLAERLGPTRLRSLREAVAAGALPELPAAVRAAGIDLEVASWVAGAADAARAELLPWKDHPASTLLGQLALRLRRTALAAAADTPPADRSTAPTPAAPAEASLALAGAGSR